MTTPPRPSSVPASAPPAPGCALSTPGAAAMPDVQRRADERQVPIDRVGVKDVIYPMRLRTPEGGEQSTVARINMYVALPHYQKGTHMSRFLEALNEHAGDPIRPEEIPDITRAIQKRLDAAEAHFEAEFTYFVKKLAPVTKTPGLMDYQVRFACTVGGVGGDGGTDFVMSV